VAYTSRNTKQKGSNRIKHAGGDMTNRVCGHCKIEKPLDEFPNKKGRNPSWCRECERACDRARNYRQDRREVIYKAKASEHGRELRAINRWKNIEETRKKERSRSMLREAIKHGEIKRLPCAICGNAKSKAHHDDYEKPFDVVWLCHKHHMGLHRNIRLSRTPERG
jgi:hypothetical protein